MKTWWVGGLLIVLFSACSSGPTSPVNNELTRSNTEVQHSLNCETLFTNQLSTHTNTIQPDSIDLLSWNVKKGQKEGWADDLNLLASDKEFVLMQEAHDHMKHHDFFLNQGYWAFAKGYNSPSGKTGVVSFSRSSPVGSCTLTAQEPWLGTAKASILTRYLVKDYPDTLLVVNTHMINFTLGTEDYLQQLGDIVNAIAGHQGPLIISGDFNTWNNRRDELLIDTLSALDVELVSFKEDYRTRFFGYTVDHVFTRGLTVRDASTHKRTSSDHNPITLSLYIQR